MKTRLCMLGMFLALWCSQADAEKHHHKIKEAQCTQYNGTLAALSDADAKFVRQVVSIFRDKKRNELLAMMDDKAQLIRRFVFSTSGRGGNLSFDLKPELIDKDFYVHVPPWNCRTIWAMARRNTASSCCGSSAISPQA